MVNSVQKVGNYLINSYKLKFFFLQIKFFFFVLDIRQKLPEVVRNAKSFAKRQTLLISCRAKSEQAYLLTKKEVSKLKKKAKKQTKQHTQTDVVEYSRHFSEPHDCVSIARPRPSQSLPPYCGVGLVQFLVLICKPPPHEALHSDHPDHSV